FLTMTLGKGVVRAKDAPNFIANRIGVFSLLAVMHYAKTMKIDFEVVDALTGVLSGRPKSGTYRTSDVVGLDTMAHVINTMKEHLKDDPWHEYFATPDYIQNLIDKGHLGQKTGAGVYKKIGREIHVLDLEKGDYRLADRKLPGAILTILKEKDVQKRFKLLRETDDKHGKFLWAAFREMFHYAAYHLEQIGDNVRDVDLAMRWGFGWAQGPFETWQSIGWQQIQDWVNEDIKAKTTLTQAKLPAWVKKQSQGVYAKGEAFAATENKFVSRSSLPVYQRQIFREPMLTDELHFGETILENESIRIWHQNDDIAIASFKTKMNTFTEEVLDGIQAGIAEAEKNYKGFIIYQTRGADFSAGANLMQLIKSIQEEGPQVAERIIDKFQQTAMRMRYSEIPTVVAVKGRALGGGCEITMHADRRVAHTETYIGLVEIGVGLLPAGGGTKEFAKIIAEDARGRDFPRLKDYFKQIAMAEVSTSAQEAVQRRFFKDSDAIVFNPNELFYVAKQQVEAMFAANYRPPIMEFFPVAGKQGIADIMLGLANMKQGGFISEYDYFLARKIATVLCGGLIEMGTLVKAQWLLDLERKVFIELLGNPKTQERIKHILETGKPLRN
ncbi:MAG: 3-hydroxyacyl-CoA dehydrogenase family protein, partial [Pseudomonadota bacterium]